MVLLQITDKLDWIFIRFIFYFLSLDFYPQLQDYVASWVYWTFWNKMCQT
jgi:hypothetical protein